MEKLRLMTIVGTRPDIIKLSQIIKKCDVYFKNILVHTGQNYDFSLNQAFFDDLQLRAPDHFLNVAEANLAEVNLGAVIGNIISRSYELMRSVKPDALLVLGDTNSTLCVISAKRLKIPIFHLEAGNRCFDENLPEEVNRRIVDQTSDVNLCYCEHARRYLFAQGIRKEYTFVVGSPMKEILDANIDRITAGNFSETLGLAAGKYILVSAHREENIDTPRNFFSLMEGINCLAEQYKMPVIYSVHPRSERFIAERNFVFHENVRRLRPFNFTQYNNLQMNSFCVASDSGTLPEEASYFHFPAVSLRTSTERPEAMDKGNFIIGNIEKAPLLQAVELATAMHSHSDLGGVVTDYNDYNTSASVVKIIQSYTSIVNKMIWRKP